MSEAAPETDALRTFDARIWERLLESGLATAVFDETLGGLGLNRAEHQVLLAKLLRVVGAADLSVARLFEGHVNAIMLVHRFGTPDQAKRLARCVRGGKLTAVWGAEMPKGLQCEPQAGGWLFTGHKILASGAGFVKRPLITFSTPAGVRMALVNMDKLGAGRADLDEWRPLGMRASATGSIDLTGLTIDQADCIGTPDNFLQQPFLSGGAWRFCAVQLGAIERLTALFCEQLRARGRDQDPYQLQRVAQCTAACGTALFWVEEAARRFGDESLSTGNIVAFANMTRMVVERAGLDVMEVVQRGVGLAGFMDRNPIQRVSRDLATYLRQPVPDLAMGDAARAALSGELILGGSD